jgi:adenylate cyclase
VPVTGEPDFVIGPFRLDRRGRSLTRDGVPVSMGRRALEVLAVLASAAGETVDKNVLLDRVWSGLTVEESNLPVHVSALRKVLGEGWIVTVPGRGYRLMVPPISFASNHDLLPAPPSVAVLAFANMSSDPDQEYFSDGIADDLITGLSHNRSLFVIARTSSFAYKGRSFDVKDIARELGVRYVVEGSVRRSGNQVRVTAQLIDAETGSHIWADRFDLDLADIFTIQDEITRAMLAAIGPAISQAERRRAMRKAPENLSAWEAYQRALSQWLWASDLSAPTHFLRRAIALDPRFAPAHAMLASRYIWEASIGAGAPPGESARLAEGEARIALELDPDSALAHAVLAWVLGFQGDQTTALEEAEIAIALNPSDPQGHLVKGRVLVFSGQSGNARESLATALRLDPRGPSALSVSVHSVIGRYFERDYLAAVAMARRAVQTWPQLYRPYPLAAALGQLGRIVEARAALAAAIGASPSFFEFITRSRPPYYYRPEDHQHMLDGLRNAGWEG